MSQQLGVMGIGFISCCFRIRSCDFVDRGLPAIANDPRNHTKSTKSKNTKDRVQETLFKRDSPACSAELADC